MSREKSLENLRNRVVELEREAALNRRTAETLERELSKFQVLYDLAIAMTSERTLDDKLQLIVDKCRELLGSDISYIALQDESHGDLYKHSSSGIRSEVFRQMRLPPGKGLGGLVTNTRQGTIVADYGSEADLGWPVRQVAAEEGLVAGMAAPIQMRDRNLGVIYVFSRSPRDFTAGELDTLTLIGNLAAVEISRKQMEEKLRESDERFRFMAETTGDVIYRLRYDSMQYDYLSPGIQKLTGYAQEEIQHSGFSSLVTRIDFPDQENVVPESIIQNRVDGRTGEFRADYLIQTRSGEFKWLRDHSFPWFDASGKNIGSVGILSDVTEYKRAEALVRERTVDLVESEEKYRSLVENLPLVVYRMRANGEIMFVNPFVEEVFGYTPLEIISNSALWGEVIHEEDREHIHEIRSQSLEGSREMIAEYRIIHKTGRIVHVIDHAIPFQTPAGAVGSMDGIIIDITGRVKLQEQIVRSEGLKTIGEVSARLAHEIRNPLVSAGGFARRLLSSMPVQDPNRAKVEIILKEVGRLESILRTILNYIQPLELELEPHDLNGTVEDILSELDTKILSTGTGVDLDLLPDLACVQFDLRQMHRVIETLLVNALHQMPDRAMLRIKTSHSPEGVTLTLGYPVKHLSPDDIQHFFYPFTTFQMACNAVDLPLCKIIVNKHHGVIEARLTEPKVMAITITLPLARADLNS
jgi:PAS domain S-box-containing protein